MCATQTDIVSPNSDNVLTLNDIRLIEISLLEANVNPLAQLFGKGWSTFAYHSKSSPEHLENCSLTF